MSPGLVRYVEARQRIRGHDEPAAIIDRLESAKESSSQLVVTMKYDPHFLGNGRISEGPVSRRALDLDM